MRATHGLDELIWNTWHANNYTRCFEIVSVCLFVVVIVVVVVLVVLVVVWQLLISALPFGLVSVIRRLPQCHWSNRDDTRWRHQMETFSALLALCAGNSPASGEFPSQRPVARSFDFFFDLRLNKRLSKQSWGWWFETPSRLLWRHCIEWLQKSCESTENNNTHLWHLLFI